MFKYLCIGAKTRVECGQGHTLVIEFVIFFALVKILTCLKPGHAQTINVVWVKTAAQKKKGSHPLRSSQSGVNFFYQKPLQVELVHLITTANSIRPITFEVVQSVVKVRRNNILHFFSIFSDNEICERRCLIKDRSAWALYLYK